MARARTEVPPRAPERGQPLAGTGVRCALDRAVPRRGLPARPDLRQDSREASPGRHRPVTDATSTAFAAQRQARATGVQRRSGR
jgi:hypothetical protein